MLSVSDGGVGGWEGGYYQTALEVEPGVCVCVCEAILQLHLSGVPLLNANRLKILMQISVR